MHVGWGKEHDWLWFRGSSGHVSGLFLCMYGEVGGMFGFIFDVMMHVG